MNLDIILSNDEVFHIPPLNIRHSYPALQPVTKIIIEDGYQWLDDVKKLIKKDNLEDGEWISLGCLLFQHYKTISIPTISIVHVAIVSHQPNYGLACNKNSP